jgi:hypothetical protein
MKFDAFQRALSEIARKHLPPNTEYVIVALDNPLTDSSLVSTDKTILEEAVSLIRKHGIER